MVFNDYCGARETKSVNDIIINSKHINSTVFVMASFEVWGTQTSQCPCCYVTVTYTHSRFGYFYVTQQRMLLLMFKIPCVTKSGVSF